MVSASVIPFPSSFFLSHNFFGLGSKACRISFGRWHQPFKKKKTLDLWFLLMDPDVPTVDQLFDEGSGWKVQIHWTVEESRMDNQKDGC